jgi:hypothetical protein
LIRSLQQGKGRPADHDRLALPDVLQKHRLKCLRFFDQDLGDAAHVSHQQAFKFLIAPKVRKVGDRGHTTAVLVANEPAAADVIQMERVSFTNGPANVFGGRQAEMRTKTPQVSIVCH